MAKKAIANVELREAGRTFNKGDEVVGVSDDRLTVLSQLTSSATNEPLVIFVNVDDDMDGTASADASIQELAKATDSTANIDNDPANDVAPQETATNTDNADTGSKGRRTGTDKKTDDNK